MMLRKLKPLSWASVGYVHEETGFLLRDLYNFFARYKKERVEGRDTEFVLKYMGGKQEEDPEYFFKYSVDDEGHLKKKIWADAQSQIDYHVFGDVIVFDSTYRVNRYNLLFVPFIGLNHHRSTVVFGCGIISDESVSSYVWLLEAFLEAMRQHHPESIITDGDIAMARAIEIVMPEADHRLCSWHIEQNMIHRLRGEKLSEFRKFVYHPMTVDNFEKHWMEYKENYGISEEDIWMVMMYDLRKKWSTAYTKGRHFLGMQSNQRSESLNSRLHKHLDRKMSLVDLVDHYEFSLSRIHRNEAELDAKASLSIPFTRMSADIFEKKAACIYTPKMFKKVREQIRRLCQWEVKEVTPENGLVKYGVGSEGVREDLVYVICIFDGSLMKNASCYCQLMEGEAIPCAHIFAVMRFLGFDNIPKCCVVERWTIQAKIAFPSDRVTNTHVRSEQMARFRGLQNKANLALFKASKSEEQSERVMRFLDEVLEEGEEDDGSMEATSFGLLPAHFSGANQRFATEVLDPNKIVAKGAPSNKRLNRFHESCGIGRSFVYMNLIQPVLPLDAIDHLFSIGQKKGQEYEEILQMDTDRARENTQAIQSINKRFDAFMKGCQSERQREAAKSHNLQTSDALQNDEPGVKKNQPDGKKDKKNKDIHKAVINAPERQIHVLDSSGPGNRDNLTDVEEIRKFREQLPVLLVKSPLNVIDITKGNAPSSQSDAQEGDEDDGLVIDKPIPPTP
ncbi:protein FAR1-RELATED SEQUENCE 5-like [Phragmites australis]|uniref:protein FAR1-RELATED SEQUENCE 5-like n=1 Tax=Phragmites australis TaxID=29695 RepID=UPI002D765AFC|nr:protein FAR1-RELATED SEQUENCE 5-like [Phragmites australis]